MNNQPTGSAALIWLEAEQFEHLGGWVNDSQFIDLMGSPYLLANGRGTPVEDAVTTVEAPVPGRYRLWARTKDWDTEHHPGPFQILLNGRAAQYTFGRSGKPGWRWEEGGVHELSGRVSLALHDLSGYYGRCDIVVLSDDLDWRPPSDGDEIEALRVRHGGLSAEIDEPPAYDVVIVGGGLAGCTAAVAAARNGASVALIQDRPVLGGNASPEILVPPCGVWNGREEGPFDPHETGLIEEYRTPGLQIATEGKLYAQRLLRWVEAEPDIDLYLNTRALRAETQSPGALSAVLAVDVRTGRRTRFRGTIYIDCSGDSTVALSAGAEYRQGKEPRSMYGEPWAPEEASPHTMGNGLKYYPVDTGQAVRYDPPPWYYCFPDCANFTPGRHPKELGYFQADGLHIGQQWLLELGGMRDTFADAEDIRDDLFRLIYGIWDHVKNSCPANAGKAATWDLGWVGHVAGKRENRRLIGNVVLTHMDIMDKTAFEDAVAYGAWVVDDHYSEGFFHDGQFGTHQDSPEDACFGEEFSIPFRSLYSRNVDNLMMAGRNISASHMAMSDTRVMFTCALMGHAAGTGAALCVHKGLTPRGVYQDCMDQLQQQLLKEGAYIIGLRADDGRDLAPRARVSASSEQRWMGGEVMAATHVVDGYARAVGGRSEDAQTHAWAPKPGPSAFGSHWIALEWEQPVTFNVVHVSLQTAELAPESFRVEVWQSGGWQTVAEVAENHHRRHVLGLDRVTTTRLRVVEREPAGIVEIRVYDEPQRQVEIARRAHANMRLPDVGPFFALGKGIKQMRHLEHEHDFCVIGGGLAGMMAAITAARAGLRVALVQDRPVLGGNASKEIRVPPVGAVNCNFAYCRETGLIEEIYLENLYRNPTGNHEGWDLVLTNTVKATAGLDCYFNTYIHDVEVNDAGDALLSVSGYTAGAETHHVYRAPLFADCTGDGTVGVLAGAPWRMGIEARSEFGESMCADEPQSHVMGASMQMRTRDAGRPMPFVKPDWVDLTIDEEHFGPHRPLLWSFLSEKGGFWWLEWGGELDTVHDTEQIKEQVQKIIYAVWDYLKNRSPIADQIATYELDWVGTLPGKRESRRLEGDHILSQVDIEQQRPFEDAVAYGGWGFDDHPKEGFFSPVIPSYHVHHKGPYNVPLRSLYSRQVLNLLLAGRDISVTHFGLSSTRVMLTCCQLGEAVGVATAYCARYGERPRQLVGSGHVRDVQVALQRADHHIHDLPYRDEDNLAFTAQATASSALPSVGLIESVGAVPLDDDRLWQFPVCTSHLSSARVLLDVDRDTQLTAILRQGAENGSTYPETTLVTQQVDVRAGKGQWATIPLDSSVSQLGWHFLELKANPHVSVHWGKNPPVGLMGYQVRREDPIRPNPFSRWGQYGRNEQVRWAYCLALAPEQPLYAPDNAVNDWSRPSRVPNLWISDPTDFARPEWLELAWDEPQDVGTVDLLFDSTLDFTFYQSWVGYEQNVMPSLVKDYRLLYRDDSGAWREMARVEGNYQRHRTHRVDGIRTKAIQLEIASTNGSERAQVYSVRVYR